MHYLRQVGRCSQIINLIINYGPVTFFVNPDLTSFGRCRVAVVFQSPTDVKAELTTGTVSHVPLYIPFSHPNDQFITDVYVPAHRVHAR